MTVAEHFSNSGKNVLLLFDSLTRYLRALRDLGLGAGELPIRQGYPASVFEDLPKLIERAGTSNRGSITAIFTLLSNNAIDEDPMINEVIGVVDGQIELNTGLAQKGHFPAIDICSSMSRLSDQFISRSERTSINTLKQRFKDKQSRNIFSKDSVKKVAAEKVAGDDYESLSNFLTQDQKEYSCIEDTNKCFSNLTK